MIGEQFYPTPKNVIRRMLEPYLKEGRHSSYNLPKYILDPSAGKGDILKFIKESDLYERYNFYACEIDINLQQILKADSDIQLIGDNFLNYNGDILFDLILMNPPFAKGDEHLLKAWDILIDGEIVCLLNAETINNPYTETRQLLSKIIEDFGSVEFLGNCFADAERKTNVEVALVRLKKTEQSNMFNFSFDNVKENNYSVNDLNSDTIQGVEVHDIISSIVRQYDRLKLAFIDYMKACQGLDFYSSGIFDEYTNILKIASDSGYKSKNSYNTFIDKIRHESWEYVLSKSGLEKFMTERVRNNFNRFIKEQGQMGFTKDNIYKVIYDIVGNADMILEQAIEDAFDQMTKYHSENRCHIEGWKTNDAWKVNRKVIFPYVVEYGKYSNAYDLKRFGDTLKINYSSKQQLLDIDKALCYITGKDFNSINNIIDILSKKFNCIGKIYTGDKFDNECTSTFFNIRFFKKGTIHIEFRDEKLWEQFNIRATKQKNWLPQKEYDAWKAKQNGEKREYNKERLIEVNSQTSLF